MAEHEQPDDQSRVLNATKYGADAIKVLDPIEAVRKRPGMYIGNLDCRAKLRMMGLLIDDFYDVVLSTQTDPDYVPHSFLRYHVEPKEWRVSLEWQSDKNGRQVDTSRHLDPSRMLRREAGGCEGCFIVNCLSKHFTLDATVPGAKLQFRAANGKTCHAEKQSSKAGKIDATISAEFVPDTTLLGDDVPSMMVIDGYMFGRSDTHRGMVIPQETRH